MTKDSKVSRRKKLKMEMQDTRREISNLKNMFAQFLENQDKPTSKQGKRYDKNKESYRKPYSPYFQVKRFSMSTTIYIITPV